MTVRLILRASQADCAGIFTGDVNWKTIDIESEEVEKALESNDWWHVVGAEILPEKKCEKALD